MTHDPLGKLRDDIAFLLEEALHSLRQDEARASVRKSLQLAPAGKGDFAYPCFPLAKSMRKSPADAAKKLVEALPQRAGIAATAEGPYVNFAADPRKLAEETLAAVQEKGIAYGTHPSNGITLIVEHTSANPNGPFHVGRARNPIVGDTLARTLRAAGYQVTTEYYVNDMGKQVAILNWGLRHLTRDQIPPTDRAKVDHQNVGFYQKANEMQEADPKIAQEIGASLHRFENGDRKTADEFREAVTLILTGMRESLARLNVHMDRYTYESEYVFNGAVQDVVSKLKKVPLAREDESGSWYLDLESYGIAGRNSKWTFTRKDGTTLYTTRDLAYHQDKFQRAQILVNVLGEDHKLTMQQLDIALDLLAGIPQNAGDKSRPAGRDVVGVSKHPEVLWISFVSLPEGKMSTRRNRVVFIDDLLDESVARAREEVEKRRPELAESEKAKIAELVGIGAVRFNIARVQTEKSIVFRWEDALNFEGDSAPFVQYAHARCASILRKAADASARIGGTAASEASQARTNRSSSSLPAQLHPSEIELAKAIAKLPYVVREAAELRRIHMLPAYAVELTNAFNAFYRDCPVMVEDDAVRAPRLAMVRAAKTALSSTLGLMGIEAPESM